MKCKLSLSPPLPRRAPVTAFLTTTGKDKIRPRVPRLSLGERMHQLAGKAYREFALADPVIVGQLTGRHVKRPEDHVQDRERRGEVLLAAAVGGRVVPAMEHGTRDHVFERAERPVEIGVNEGRMGG